VTAHNRFSPAAERQQADTLTAVAAFDRYDTLHAQFGLAERTETDPAIRALSILTNDLLRELARRDGVNPNDLSLVPALTASLQPKRTPEIESPAA
jgi:hypothetical protein